MALLQIGDSGRKISEAIREKNIKDKKGEVGCMLLVDNEKIGDLSESEAALKVLIILNVLKILQTLITRICRLIFGKTRHGRRMIRRL